MTLPTNYRICAFPTWFGIRSLIDDQLAYRGGDFTSCARSIVHSTSLLWHPADEELARSLPAHESSFYLSHRSQRARVLAQMRSGIERTEQYFNLAYLKVGEIKEQCDAICRFGQTIPSCKRLPFLRYLGLRRPQSHAVIACGEGAYGSTDPRPLSSM